MQVSYFSPSFYATYSYISIKKLFFPKMIKDFYFQSLSEYTPLYFFLDAWILLGEIVTISLLMLKKNLDFRGYFVYT